MISLSNIKVAEHEVRIIAIAEELLSNNPASEISTINDKWKVITFFEYKKGDIFPGGMFYLATGKEINEPDIWGFYKRSKRILFYLVEKI